jgi:hypothetical protein
MRVVKYYLLVLAAFLLGLSLKGAATNAEFRYENVQKGDDELYKLRKARLDIVEKELENRTRTVFDSGRPSPEAYERLFTMSYQRLFAALDLVEEPKARVDLLKQHLEFAKKMENDYQVKFEANGQGGNGRCFRAFTLAVEIELEKARKVVAKAN